MADEREFKSVESSTISGVHYDEAERRLHIRFKNGGEYSYADVDPGVHDDLMSAESIGKHFHKHIRGKFETRKH